MNDVLEIRKGTAADIPSILDIFDAARAFMRQYGNTVQWTNGYPDEDIVLQDITNGNCYVCTDEGTVVGVLSLIFGEDPTYGVIDGGHWLNDGPYATIHRIATANRRKGVAASCMDWCFRQCGNLRIDTHEVNKPMRSLIEKCGFQYCGIVHMADGTPRLAYQKSET